MTLRLVHAERKFAAGDWCVRVICVPWLPGDDQARQLYEVQHEGHLRFQTIDVARIRAALGDDLFGQLEEVEP